MQLCLADLKVAKSELIPYLCVLPLARGSQAQSCWEGSVWVQTWSSQKNGSWMRQNRMQYNTNYFQFPAPRAASMWYADPWLVRNCRWTSIVLPISLLLYHAIHETGRDSQTGRGFSLALTELSAVRVVLFFWNIKGQEEYAKSPLNLFEYSFTLLKRHGCNNVDPPHALSYSPQKVVKWPQDGILEKLPFTHRFSQHAVVQVGQM